VRYSQRHIWHWRDWIIESVNKDKGYGEMVVEMLAGDELAPNDPDVVRATGYLAELVHVRPQCSVEGHGRLHGMVSWTDREMRRCHSHKYDPITHEDYYRFRAFFEPYDVRTDRCRGSRI